VVKYYHNILPELRRPYALLWCDVRGLLVPAAAGRLSCGEAFAAAALDALDRIGFRQESDVGWSAWSPSGNVGVLTVA